MNGEGTGVSSSELYLDTERTLIYNTAQMRGADLIGDYEFHRRLIASELFEMRRLVGCHARKHVKFFVDVPLHHYTITFRTDLTHFRNSGCERNDDQLFFIF